MGRVLFVLMIGSLAPIGDAHAQSGGIQVAPVLVALTSEDNIASLRVRNGRDRPVAFEVDVYSWRQQNGEDVLTPSNDVLVAPGVFEIAADREQVIRLGVTTPAGQSERAYRLILRELPTQRAGGSVLGFTLELSLPVFVTPVGARAAIQTYTEPRDAGSALVIANTGAAHVQIASITDADAGALAGPRYLLAGSSAEITLSPRSRAVRLRAAENSGSQIERLVHVDASDSLASVR